MPPRRLRAPCFSSARPGERFGQEVFRPGPGLAVVADAAGPQGADVGQGQPDPGLGHIGGMPAPHGLADAAISGLVVDLEMGDRGLRPDFIRDRPLRDGPVVELGGGRPRPAWLRSAASRIRNGISAPRAMATVQLGLAFGGAAERGQDLGPACVDEPVGGPGGDDPIEQEQGVRRTARGPEVLGLLDEPVEDAIARPQLDRAGHLGSGRFAALRP